MKKIFLLLLLAPFFGFAIDLPTPTPLVICEADNDGFSDFDLTSKNNEITGGLPNYTVTFYETLADAQNETSPILNPTGYFNISNPQTIHVRVVNANDSSDLGLTTLTIQVFPMPEYFTLPWLIICESDSNGIETFDLTGSLMYAEMLQNFSCTATAHETMTDAELGINTLPTTYVNTVPNEQMLYVRIQSNSSECFVVVQLRLKVTSPPVAGTIDSMVVYQQPFSGTAYFWLGQAISQAINGQENVGANCYLSESEAIAGLGHLPTCYTNTAATETIWVRVYDNNNFDCYTLTSFTVTVSADANPNPVVSIPDANFKQALLTMGNARTECGVVMAIDVNGDGEIQTDEAKRVGRLAVNNASIASLEGIKAFTNLSGLSCANNQLTELDLAGLARLTGLECGVNQLVTLDLSQTGVQTLGCANNNLIWINLKNNRPYFTPVEFPNFWNDNPLVYVCADADEVPSIEGALDFYNMEGVTVTTDCSLLGNDEKSLVSFTMYPNPAQHSVNVTAQSAIKKITLFDMQGRSVASFNADATDATIDVSSLSKGLYLMQVATDSGRAVQKFVKQ